MHQKFHEVARFAVPPFWLPHSLQCVFSQSLAVRWYRAATLNIVYGDRTVVSVAHSAVLAFSDQPLERVATRAGASLANVFDPMPLIPRKTIVSI